MTRAPDRRDSYWNEALLSAGVVLCLVLWTPPIALGVGVVLALLGVVSPGEAGKRWSRLLIQVCVVMMGFGMDLREVLRAGVAGTLFAAASIATTLWLGLALGRWLRTDAKVTTLLSAGTAICGGSAIAAVGSVIGATGAQIGISLATVFVLNGAALYIFPVLGHELGLSAHAFGVWAAVAIHDVSSVVGAASAFDAASLETATAVKLSRALWIVPVAALAARWHARGASREAAPKRGTGDSPKAASKRPAIVPWFIAAFVGASALRTAIPALEAVAPDLRALAKAGMTTALFLIGAGLSRRALASLGWRPLALGVALWLFISVASLGAIALLPL